MRISDGFLRCSSFALMSSLALGSCSVGSGNSGGAAEIEPNDSWNEATLLGEGSGDFSFKGALAPDALAPDEGGGFFPVDWFKVQTSTEGMARATLSLDPQCLTFVVLAIWQNGVGHEQVSADGNAGTEIEVTGAISHCPGCVGGGYTLSTALVAVAKTGNAECSPIYKGTFATP